jgi:hypothetical protein
MRVAASFLAIVTLCGACEGVESDDGAQPLPSPGKGDAVTSGLPFISEYVEGSVGYNKAVEIFNPLPFDASLDGCQLRIFSNGRTTSNLRVSLDGAEIERAGTLLVCHSRAEAIEGCDIESGSLSFNGNDAIDLACDFGDGAATLDVFGIVGEAPGGGWAVDGATSKDQSVRRRCSVPAGHDAFVAAQWEAAGANAFGDLGRHELCDEQPEPASCSLGEGVLGGPAAAILDGEDARFEVVIDQPVFRNTTERHRDLLLAAVLRFPSDDEVTDVGDAVASIARQGGRIETFTIRDTETGTDFDAVRYFANDATEHAIVVLAGEEDPVAFGFDGEFFECAPEFCTGGDLTRPFFQQLDEDFNPTDRYEILSNEVVLAAFERRNRVFRSTAQPTLLSVAWQEHFDEQRTSLEALESIAREGTGTLTYKFVSGPQEDYEGVVFQLGTDHGMLVVEDSLDAEALTRDGEVVSCAG